MERPNENAPTPAAILAQNALVLDRYAQIEMALPPEAYEKLAERWRLKGRLPRIMFVFRNAIGVRSVIYTLHDRTTGAYTGGGYYGCDFDADGSVAYEAHTQSLADALVIGQAVKPDHKGRRYGLDAQVTVDGRIWTPVAP